MRLLLPPAGDPTGRFCSLLAIGGVANRGAKVTAQFLTLIDRSFWHGTGDPTGSNDRLRTSTRYPRRRDPGTGTISLAPELQALGQSGKPIRSLIAC
jgi:hypothetical protein